MCRHTQEGTYETKRAHTEASKAHLHGLKGLSTHCPASKTEVAAPGSLTNRVIPCSKTAVHEMRTGLSAKSPGSCYDLRSFPPCVSPASDSQCNVWSGLLFKCTPAVICIHPAGAGTQRKQQRCQPIPDHSWLQWPVGTSIDWSSSCTLVTCHETDISPSQYLKESAISPSTSEFLTR